MVLLEPIVMSADILESLHSLVKGGYLFCNLSEPTRDELLEVAIKINRKVLKCADDLGLLVDDSRQGFNEESLVDYAASKPRNTRLRERHS